MYSFKNIFIEAYMKINTKLNFCIKLTKHNVFLRWCIILLKSESRLPKKVVLFTW